MNQLFDEFLLQRSSHEARVDDVLLQRDVEGVYRDLTHRAVFPDSEKITTLSSFVKKWCKFYFFEKIVLILVIGVKRIILDFCVNKAWFIKRCERK